MMKSIFICGCIMLIPTIVKGGVCPTVDEVSAAIYAMMGAQGQNGLVGRLGVSHVGQTRVAKIPLELEKVEFDPGGTGCYYKVRSDIAGQELFYILIGS